MPVKEHKPTTPGQRTLVSLDRAVLDKKRPEKRLTVHTKSKAGRNVAGRVTSRHRGGGHKQRIRVVDFKRDKDNIEARVAAIEYDPGRSAFVALLHYADGEKRYILAPDGLRKGDTVISGERAPIRPGNSLPLGSIPPGTVVHNVELQPGRGGQLVRGAGTSAQIMAREGKYVHLRLPSNEVRLVPTQCRGTIGRVGNVDRINISDGKAGRARWKGKRPHVRGVAMNPVDHPHGGGEGKAPIGHPSPLSPWGKKTLGKKTRPKHKQSDKYIVRRRRAKR